MNDADVTRVVDLLGLQIDMDNWGPDPANPGYLAKGRRMTHKEVFGLMRRALEIMPVPDDVNPYPERHAPRVKYMDVLDYFGFGPEPSEEYTEVPAWWRVAVYAVTGGSEGYYIHVDLTREGEQPHINLAIGKTFAGWDVAWAVAKYCALVLGA